MYLTATLSPELSVVLLVVGILFLASLLAIAPLRKIRLPFTVAMMLVGLGVGALGKYLATHDASGLLHETRSQQTRNHDDRVAIRSVVLSGRVVDQGELRLGCAAWQRKARGRAAEHRQPEKAPERQGGRSDPGART